MSEEIKEYNNGEVTVIWKAELCQHSGNCVRGLGKVFNPKARPWIDVSQGTSAEIVETVHRCPSGALTIKEK
ncbi:(4Fe-4S)-binding protein [Cytophagales bacterium LB-30]|uniref:(4Fe-4S)-binding protein n=1 Tax=Shiella aurantiaca TaxID=3058365 RepID=A0ABT8F805_9BACT|nr:(4Fe-4S)-binding protein [Shiella aurantiaca]MDN4166413.1 (4Fe-4S)-binding protein [Shiella aurantiaca]